MTATLPAGYERDQSGRLRPPPIFAERELDPDFWRDGFVKVPGLDPDELAHLIERFAELRPSDGFDPTQLADPRCSYHCTFLDTDRTYRRAADELVRDVFGARLAAILPGYRILSSNIYVKPPGHGRFEIHQNWPTIEELDVPTLTVWVPIQPTSFDNGTIRLVKGSHHLFPDVAAASSDRFFDDFETELIENYLDPVDVEAGEALIFDDSLLHWSGANRSTRPRTTFQIEMVPTDARGVLWIRSSEDPDHFDLWEAERDYWIEYPFESVFGRPEGLTYVGRRDNPNRRIGFDEFEAAMAQRDEIRQTKYDLS